MAHELGHALDPRFDVLGDREYKEAKYHGDYEAIADIIAKRSLESFGLMVDDYEGYLDRVLPSWRRRIRSKLRDRIFAAGTPLCKPRHPDSTAAQRVTSARKRALRRARAETRRAEKDYKPPPRLPPFIKP